MEHLAKLKETLGSFSSFFTGLEKKNSEINFLTHLAPVLLNVNVYLIWCEPNRFAVSLGQSWCQIDFQGGSRSAEVSQWGSQERRKPEKRNLSQLSQLVKKSVWPHTHTQVTANEGEEKRWYDYITQSSEQLVTTTASLFFPHSLLSKSVNGLTKTLNIAFVKCAEISWWTSIEGRPEK